MIRPIIHHMVEGHTEHDLAKYIFERLVVMHKNPTMHLCSNDAKDALRGKAEYPGLPDLMWRYTVGKELYKFIGEIETNLDRETKAQKYQQFKGPGITDVIFMDLADFHREYHGQCTDWVLLEKWLKQYVM